MPASPFSPAFLQLRDRLHEVFGFQNHDLDFGIYRVLRLKRQEITRFIEEELPRIVQDALAQVRDAQRGYRLDSVVSFVNEEGGRREKAWLTDPVANATELADYIRYIKPENADQLLSVLAEATAATADHQAEAIESRVYNHLLAFVERYYRDGDFGYNDRSLATYRVNYPEATTDTTALPATQASYDGRDVLFHWKHRDSYYIKTGGSFGAVAFALDSVDMPGHAIELWLEAEAQDAGGVAQNNNRDTGKHFRFERIEPRTEALPDDTSRTVHRVVFRLSQNASTPKVDLYQTLLAEVFGDTDAAVPAWLRAIPAKGETEGKSLFNDIDGQYDKVQEGMVKGVGSLRLDVSKYLETLAKNPAFAGLGKNGPARAEALATDLRTRRLLLLDQRFNAFVAGTDHDYFIHKNLDGFLHQEQRRYLQEVLLGDLDTLLAGQPDSAALVQARAFRSVTDALIGLLSSVEEFQKSLFLRRKLVVGTRWLCSVGKLQASGAGAVVLAALWEDVLRNQPQLTEWRETFGVSIADPMQLLQHPTLVLDTRHFTPEEYPHFQDRLLACFSDLEAATDGLLLNSENFQALNLLKERYRSSIDCIYIDPPYNTGGDGFLYKDRFRHSSWLSMMQDRLEIGKDLLANSGVLFGSIDNNEMLGFKHLMNELFDYRNEAGMIVWKGATDNNPTRIAIEHEYILSYVKDLKASPSVWRSDSDDTKELMLAAYEDFKEHSSSLEEIQTKFRRFVKENKESLDPLTHYIHIDEDGPYTGSRKVHNPGKQGYDYVIPHDKNGKPTKKPARGYRYPKTAMDDLIARNKIIFGEDESQIVQIKEYLKDYNGSLKGIINNLDSRIAANTLESLFGSREIFKNPKPVELIEKLLAFTTQKNSITLDFFAGSGATGQSIINLNKADNGRRRFILVEQGEYFERVLLERVKRSAFSQKWKSGSPEGSANGSEILVQVLKLEQYEDVLNALEIDHSEIERPEGVGVRYLFRPEEQRARTSLDLSKPFTQPVLYGRQRQAEPADLLESYLWLVGLVPRQRGHLLIADRLYRWVRSGIHLVVFRDVVPGQSDDEALRQVLAAARAAAPGTADITTLHVNQEADYLTPPEPGLVVRPVTAADFDRGTTWSAS